MPEPKKKNWETPRILSDSPLRDDDEANFHFDQFAVTLARLIADPETRTPLTIGISGKWGSGKTTLLRRVKVLLDRRDGKNRPFFANEGETAKDFRTCKTVWFDAWKYNDESELLVALVRVILNTMGRGNLGEQLWSEILDKTAPRYDVLATFVNMFKVKFGGLEIGLDLNKYKTDTEFYKHTAFFDHFNSAFEELLARWVHGKGDFAKIDEKKGALVVFIDDLDRCLPEKVVQVLEAVKLFLDKDGCVFVLGADTDIVQEAVVKHYNDAGVKGENVGDYTEKLIQLRFALPPIPEEDMNAYVKGQVQDKALVEHWKIITYGAGANLRKVKTFLNDLRLRWAMWQNTGQAGGVNFDDFVRWEVLMRAAPKFRARVYNITDAQLRYGLVQNAFNMAGGDEAAAASFKEDVNPQMREILKNILEYKGRFTQEVVSRLMYVVAPPVIETPKVGEKAPAEAEEIPPKEARVEVLHEKAIRGEGTAPRAGIQTWADIPYVPIPAGKFLMGSRKDNKLAYDNEKEQHTVEIAKDYWIGQFPVTNEQYDLFIQAKNGKHPVSDRKKKKDHPVVNVSWNDAQAYCKWLNETHGAELPKGYSFRLPTEAEWEKAARGEYGNEWPWGNEFDPSKCNSSEGGKGGTTPVGAYSPAGDSPYGAADMAGNVWEWTQSLYKDYPYRAGDGREDLKASGSRVLRGGSWNNGRNLARCSVRFRDAPDSFYPLVGFRVVGSPSFQL